MTHKQRFLQIGKFQLSEPDSAGNLIIRQSPSVRRTTRGQCAFLPRAHSPPPRCKAGHEWGVTCPGRCCRGFSRHNFLNGYRTNHIVACRLEETGEIVIGINAVQTALEILQISFREQPGEEWKKHRRIIFLPSKR